MATEIELKLSLPPEAAARVGRHPLLRDQPVESRALPSTYFDTPDLALTALKVAVRQRRQQGRWLLAVKSAESGSGGLAARSEWEVPVRRGEFDFAAVDSPPLRQRLEEARGDLVPVFTTRIRRTRWQLAYGAARIEVALDRGSIVSGDRREPICELELELLQGEVGELFALARELQADLPLHPALASKAERGYALFLGTVARPVKAVSCPLPATLTPRAAFRDLALAALEHLQRNEAGVGNAAEPEFLHQARVALRRLRALLRLFAPVLPAEFVADFSPRWRALAQVLGAARDRDVLLLTVWPTLAPELPTELAAVWRAAIERQSGRARRAAARALGDTAYRRLLLDFTAALYALPAGEGDLPAFAAGRLGRLLRRLRRRARLLQQTAGDGKRNELGAAQHRLRLQIKALRYALEFLRPFCRRESARRWLLSLSAAQEQLGRANDWQVAGKLLAGLRGAGVRSAERSELLAILSRRAAADAGEVAAEIRVWRRQMRPARAPWK